MLKFETESQSSSQLKTRAVNSSNLVKLLVGTILLGSVNGLKLNFDPKAEDVDHCKIKLKLVMVQKSNLI
jgi:hypothetical protein